MKSALAMVAIGLIAAGLSAWPDARGQQSRTTTGSPWAGTWTLDVRRSRVSVPLAGPSGFTVISQTLTIEATARDLRLTGQTEYSDDRGQHTATDDNRMHLDGTPTQVGPVSLRIKRLDGATGFA